jgi:aerobic carbon-monoxide dehydrogenase medium subunit
MKPAPFHYHDPRTVDDVVSLLGQFGEDAKILAGGQSLVPLMNFRLARPRYLVDINKVSSLDYIREEDHRLVIGALARHRMIEFSDLVHQKNPLLIEACREIGHPAIRNRGTVCGSLAHADPAAEWPALALVMDATMVVRGLEGERHVPASDFFVSYFMTCLDPRELLVEVRVPELPLGAGSCFLEVSRRHGDFALVGAAVWLTADSNGICADCGIALAGVAPCAVRARAAEQRLKGERLTDSLFAQVATGIPDELDPTSDIHASADYRRKVAAEIVRRALSIARQRVRKS